MNCPFCGTNIDAGLLHDRCRPVEDVRHALMQLLAKNAGMEHEHVPRGCAGGPCACTGECQRCIICGVTIGLAVPE